MLPWSGCKSKLAIKIVHSKFWKGLFSFEKISFLLNPCPSCFFDTFNIKFASQRFQFSVPQEVFFNFSDLRFSTGCVRVNFSAGDGLSGFRIPTSAFSLFQIRFVSTSFSAAFFGASMPFRFLFSNHYMYLRFYMYLLVVSFSRSNFGNFPS